MTDHTLVLIAHQDPDYSRSLATTLREAGYAAILCPAARAVSRRHPDACLRCLIGSCVLTDGADLLIYDPSLMSLHMDSPARVCNLAVESARAHPDIPLIVVDDGLDSAVQAVLDEVPRVKRAPLDPAAMLEQVQLIAGPPGTPRSTARPIVGAD